MNGEDFFDEMKRMHEEMDRIFGHLSSANMLPGTQVARPRSRFPLAEVYETESSVIAVVELPGVQKQDIDLRIKEDVIEVKAEQRHESEEKKGGSYRYASTSNQFFRRLQLPAEVNADEAKAEMKDGILRIELPKSKGKTRKISIQ